MPDTEFPPKDPLLEVFSKLPTNKLAMAMSTAVYSPSSELANGLLARAEEDPHFGSAARRQYEFLRAEAGKAATRRSPKKPAKADKPAGAANLWLAFAEDEPEPPAAETSGHPPVDISGTN